MRAIARPCDSCNGDRLYPFSLINSEIPSCFSSMNNDSWIRPCRAKKKEGLVDFSAPHCAQGMTGLPGARVPGSTIVPGPPWHIR